MMDYTLVLLIVQVFVSVTGQITGPDRPTTGVRLFLQEHNSTDEYEVANFTMLHAGLFKTLSGDTFWCQSANNGSSIGDWYFPNGSQVMTANSNIIHVLHRDGQIGLLRNEKIGDSEGLYRCAIPDENDVNQTLWAGIYRTITYNNDTKKFTIENPMVLSLESSSRDTDPPVFTLSFNVTNVPPQRIECYVNNTIMVDVEYLDRQVIVAEDPVGVLVTVTINSRQSGSYHCAVNASSAGGVNTSTDPLNITVTDIPTNLTITRPGFQQAIISWSPPVSNNPIVQGYEVFYNSPNGTRLSIDVGNNTMTTIEDFDPKLNYSVFVVAYGGDLPSAASNRGNISKGPTSIVTITTDTTDTFIRGTRRYITCNIILNPSLPMDTNVMLEWRKDGVLFDNSTDRVIVSDVQENDNTYSSTITFSPLNTTDGGNYECIGIVDPETSNDNNISSSNNGSLSVTVNDIADANVTQSASGTGMINDGYSLTCTVSIFDSLIGFYTNLTLEKMTDNGYQVLDYSTGTNITVDLSPLTTVDAGMYKCSYDIRQDDINYQSIFEDSININITIPPPVVTTDPDNLSTLIEGTYIDLVCNNSINEGVDTNISVTVVWSVGGTTIANGSEYSISNVELVSGYYISTVRIEELEVTVNNAVFTCTVTATPLISTFITGNNGNNNITISVQEFGGSDVTVAITFSSVPTAGDQLNVTCSAIVPERLIHSPSSFVISYDVDSQSIVAEDNPNATQSNVSRDDNIFSRIVTIDPVTISDARRYFCNVTFDNTQLVVFIGNNSLHQDVPEPPVNLTAEEINSRNITLTWVEPRDNKAKYRVSYTTPSFLGSTNLSNETNTVMIVISDLHPGEYYTFTVRAINKVGISEESVPLTIRTAEEEPSGFPQNLTAMTINSTAITVSWEEVLVIETNGIITHYNIIGMPDATFSVPTVEEIVDNSTFSIQFNHLEEFVIYRFTISARTVIGFGPRSPEESAQTDEAASSAVVNMSAVAITATRILVQWEAPQYPNRPISYFSVCINVSVCFNALPNDTSYTLINLTSLSINDITVQPFTVFEGNTLVGMISIVRSVLINTTSPVTGPTSVDQRTTGTITVTLPSYTSFGKDLIFYGVIVTDRSECEDVTDFGTAYPNPQPRGDSNNDDYYIAAGWSDTSLIPDQFTAGDGDSTIATLLDQVVTFTNPRLDNFKRYCVIAIVHHHSGVINQPISRYVNLGSAVTRLGYIREILGFVMTLIQLLIVGIVAVILIFLYRRYKKSFSRTISSKTFDIELTQSPAYSSILVKQDQSVTSDTASMKDQHVYDYIQTPLPHSEYEIPVIQDK